MDWRGYPRTHEAYAPAVAAAPTDTDYLGIRFCDTRRIDNDPVATHVGISRPAVSQGKGDETLPITGKFEISRKIVPPIGNRVVFIPFAERDAALESV